jgi:hypothetical protein
MPSVTFCFWSLETKDLNSLFSKADFRTPNGSTTTLAGEHFSGDFFWDFFKLNHFTNKRDATLFTAYRTSDTLIFLKI